MLCDACIGLGQSLDGIFVSGDWAHGHFKRVVVNGVDQSEF